MTVYIQLTTAGTNTGPFNLFSNVDGFTTAFESGVAKSALVAGYTSALVPNGTTTIRVQSVGACTNYIDIVIDATTTTTTTSTGPTTTTTTTVTPAECGEFSLEGGISGRTFNFTNCAGSPQTVVVNAGDATSECIELPYSAAGATYLNPCGSSILSFSYIGGNDVDQAGTFVFNLSNPLPSNITITAASIAEYDFGCMTVLGTASSIGTATISAGNLGGSLTSTSLVCSDAYSRTNSITVNGFALVNGDTINIGGVTLNISINTGCTVMSCLA